VLSQNCVSDSTLNKRWCGQESFPEFFRTSFFNVEFVVSHAPRKVAKNEIKHDSQTSPSFRLCTLKYLLRPKSVERGFVLFKVCPINT